MRGLILSSLFLTCAVQAGPRVAVLDTGYNYKTGTAKLCATGHHDFTKEGLTDGHSSLHGTNIASLISNYAAGADHCIVLLKIISKSGHANNRAYYAALSYAAEQKFEIINLSISGKGYEPEEARLVKTLLNRGATVIAAAGNDGINMDIEGCVVYPACVDKRIYVVGSKLDSSNRGAEVDIYLPGRNYKAGGVTLSGTSQATAQFTGLVIRKLGEK